jgi:hypothetical protein
VRVYRCRLLLKKSSHEVKYRVRQALTLRSVPMAWRATTWELRVSFDPTKVMRRSRTPMSTRGERGLHRRTKHRGIV